MHSIVVIGGGAMGTAVANSLALARKERVTIVLRNADTVDSINTNGTNNQYFPGFPLSNLLLATTDIKCVSQAKIVFLAIPSGSILDYVHLLKEHLQDDVIIVNLAKGLGIGIDTLIDGIESIIECEVCSMKGPTFATEIIRNLPSAFTIASKNDEVFNIIKNVFSGSQIYFDYSYNVRAVEFVSTLKNIYAIMVGVVDAQMNSTNTRFLVMTKAFAEINKALCILAEGDDVMFKYCGYGDFGLTALNDMSRNRTLGLLVGKGFLSSANNNGVIVEGAKSLNLIWSVLQDNNNFPIMGALVDLMSGEIKTDKFISRLLIQS